jgi:flagellar biosynthesis protein FlhG
MTEPAHDQARALRRLVSQSAGAGPRAGGAKLVVLTGSKGGVGTTTVAVHLAAALAGQGRPTVLVDADPEGGDVAALLGLDERHTVADVLSGRRSVAEALQSAPDRLRVLPGAWGLDLMADCSAAAQERLLEELRGLPGTDAIVLDAGAGTSRLVRRFWQAADAVLLVTTADLTAVMDAYASIKVLAAGDDLLPVRVVVNRAEDAAAAEDVHARLDRACRRFLGLRPTLAGSVPEDSRLAGGTAGELEEIRTLAKTLWGARKVGESLRDSPAPVTE